MVQTITKQQFQEVSFHTARVKKTVFFSKSPTQWVLLGFFGQAGKNR